VCRRWARLMDSTPVKRRKPEDLWAAYALGSLNQPRTLAGISQHVHLIAVGLDGTICSTSRGGAVTVLRGGNGGRALSRQMLKIDTDEVYALAVGPDGKVYVGSHESMLTVWSDSLHTQTLHSNSIRSLAVGLDGKIYSGSADNTITVRRPDDFAHLNTLVGHTDAVVALAVGLDGRVYSGSDDRTIRVWSGADGTHLRSLMGLTGVASCLAAGIDGKIYSGGSDGQIRVWRGDDGAPLKTIPTVGAEHQITRCKH
jgi:WD40 repeat protein